MFQQQIEQLFMFHEASKLSYKENKNFVPHIQKEKKKRRNNAHFHLPKMPVDRLFRLYHYSHLNNSIQPSFTVQTLSQLLFYSHHSFTKSHPQFEAAPLFCYIISAALPPLSAYPFIGKYDAEEHTIEIIRTLSTEEWKTLTKGMIKPNWFLCITSQFNKTFKHYHFKKFQVDVGHLLTNFLLIGQQLNFHGQLISHFPPSMLDDLLNVSFGERCECVLNFHPNLGIPIPTVLPALPPTQRHHLSSSNEIAQTLQELTHKQLLQPLVQRKKVEKKKILERRRVQSFEQSTQFDKTYIMPYETFEQILQSLVTTLLHLRYEWLPWRESLQFAIFIHRVAGIKPGLYVLFLNDKQMTSFRSQCKIKFKWKETIPRYRLFLLYEAPLDEMISDICIADPFIKDSCLTMSFVTSFKPFISTYGVSMYQRLFWEAGLVAELIRLECRLEKLDTVGHPFFYEQLFERIMGISHYEEYMNTYHLSIGKWSKGDS